MLFYCNVKTNPAVFTSFTGLTVAEFEGLLPHFEKSWEAHREEGRVTGQERQRKPGGGAAPGTLRTAEGRPFFILATVKPYPLQAVPGFLFGMSQSRANDWITRLGTVLKNTGLGGGLAGAGCRVCGSRVCGLAGPGIHH